MKSLTTQDKIAALNEAIAQYRNHFADKNFRESGIAAQFMAEIAIALRNDSNICESIVKRA